MKLIINNMKHELDCDNAENIKVYRVPDDYSVDGLYIAKWKYGEIEPFPACLGSDAHLIANGRIKPAGIGDSGALIFDGEYFEEGINICQE